MSIIKLFKAGKNIMIFKLELLVMLIMINQKQIQMKILIKFNQFHKKINLFQFHLLIYKFKFLLFLRGLVEYSGLILNS